MRKPPDNSSNVAELLKLAAGYGLVALMVWGAAQLVHRYHCYRYPNSWQSCVELQRKQCWEGECWNVDTMEPRPSFCGIIGCKQ